MRYINLRLTYLLTYLLTTTRISHRHHDLQGQSSRSQSRGRGHTVSAELGGHTCCFNLYHLQWSLRQLARYCFCNFLISIISLLFLCPPMHSIACSGGITFSICSVVPMSVQMSHLCQYAVHKPARCP